MSRDSTSYAFWRFQLRAIRVCSLPEIRVTTLNYSRRMRETTAEIWIGPDQSSDWMGTQGGINATHLLLLRENSRPAWMLLPGNLYDAKPPTIGPAKVWVPTPKTPIQDALLLFAVMGAKVPEVRAVLNEFEKSRSKSRLDLAGKFPRGVPKQVHEACQRHLSDWHVVISVGDHSLAKIDIGRLGNYSHLNIEVRETSVSYARKHRR